MWFCHLHSFCVQIFLFTRFECSFVIFARLECSFRCGRTARAGKPGLAVTILNNDNDVSNFQELTSCLQNTSEEVEVKVSEELEKTVECVLKKLHSKRVNKTKAKK